MTDQHTLPRDHDHQLAAVVEASVEDERTGALWVHKDLVKVRDDWAIEDHVGPHKANESFGDVESWASYVKRFGTDEDEANAPLITWNSSGLHAVLDYHTFTNAGRLQWTAHFPFVHSPEWKAWMAIATGHAISHKTAIEFLEDHAPDIQDPPEADLTSLLRALRASVQSVANTELKPDGTTNVFFEQNKSLRSAQGGTAELPHEFTIAIPVLKGHVDSAGKPVLYQLKVRLRASVDSDAHLALRLSIPNAERALESVYADQVAEAKRLLGEQFDVLRAAG